VAGQLGAAADEAGGEGPPADVGGDVLVQAGGLGEDVKIWLAAQYPSDLGRTRTTVGPRRLRW
jgi:hypothetical protein